MLSKKKLREYLVEKGIYNEVDEFLIDEFVFNLKLIDEAKRDISKRGIVMNIASAGNNPYFQKNISLSVMETATKTLLAISKKLALSPLDRAALKVDNVNEESDGFGD